MGVPSSDRSPEFRIWVNGTPQTYRKNKKSLSRYIENIQNAVREIVPFPIKSGRIDIEIWFNSEHLRPDVDNIIKPILDALIGIVYEDDKQVRSVKVTALPHDDAYTIQGWIKEETIDRLENEEFFIDIYHGLEFPGPAVDVKN
jgi:crossover junction endodeoxyribonuclease RusA